MPSITLVTPVGPSWNLAWLQELAHSVLASTTQRIQWIVVSDGEPLREISQVIRKVTKHTQVDVQFIWLKRRHGPSGARNAALTYVRAPWVVAVDHDDLLAPGSLDALLNAVEQQDLLWGAGSVIEVDECGLPLDIMAQNPFGSRKRLMKNAFFLYRKNQGSYPFQTHGGAIVSTSYVQKYGWDMTMGSWGDHLAFFTTLSAQHEGAWVATPVLYHRHHEQSLQAQNAQATAEMEQMIYNRLVHLAK